MTDGGVSSRTFEIKSVDVGAVRVIAFPVHNPAPDDVGAYIYDGAEEGCGIEGEKKRKKLCDWADGSRCLWPFTVTVTVTASR